MESYVTSYYRLFQSPNGPGGPMGVERVEIPLIQRDYAQGRQTDTVKRIRADFLDALHGALVGTSPEPVGLDFVYGEVDRGTLRPLDGQQRLTTLFLLHWYLAARLGVWGTGDAAWTDFSYATRPSARLFCKRICSTPPPVDARDLSAWIRDQSWYQYVWNHDATIQSMLVMIEDIERRFDGCDLGAAWALLTDAAEPAISFHVLGIDDMGSSEELYIKMNSRGKPLTPFENFKARFETSVQHSKRADEIAHKMDGIWSDLLWEFRGEADAIDDEYIRYAEFLIEACEWRGDTSSEGSLEQRAERVFGSARAEASEHIDFFVAAFDTWIDERGQPVDIASQFEMLLAAPSERYADDATSRVVLYGLEDHRNLFEACCETFGEMRGKNRVFTRAQSLLLYAVLTHRIQRTDDFPRRLRVLRNVAEASNNEIRQENMSRLIREVDEYVRGGSLDALRTFSTSQVDDERRKANFLAQHPHFAPVLFHLEDHRLLRGALASFDMDPAKFESRAVLFDELFSAPERWSALTAALLAVGEYQQQRSAHALQFGTGSGANENTWRDLLTGRSGARIAPTRDTLGQLLDTVQDGVADVDEALGSISSSWLAERESESHFDWRYYFVKYEAMREGRSGIYVSSDGIFDYSMCMLNKTQLNSNYRDPYLLAMARELANDARVEDPWFTGYANTPRWLRLSKTRVGLRCEREALIVTPPLGRGAKVKAFERVCREFGAEPLEEGMFKVAIRQDASGDRVIDTEDRVQRGVELLRLLIAERL